MRISAHFASAHATSALICCAHALLSAGPAHSGVDCSKLPLELLSAILQHMPQQHRFSSCTTVSTAWAAAAVAAAHSISIKRGSLTALQHTWAACAPRYAAQLTHLSLSNVGRSYKQLCSLHLPCARLRALEVSGVGVQLMPEPLWQPASSAQAAQARLAAPSLPGLPE